MRLFKSIVVAVTALAGAVTLAQAPTDLAPPLTPQPATSNVTPARVSPPPGRHELTQADLDAWLDGYMPFALHSGDLAGAVVTVVKDGQLLTARGYGYANIEKRKPVDPYRTLFRPGSVSKLVTWTAVMQQVEAGKLDLDADVNRYLDFKIPPYDGRPITLRQVMTHTAGFEEQAKYIIFTDPKHITPLGEYLKRWIPKRIYAPGTTPAYSNWATTLAAYMVQRVSGMPFDTYVEQRIFQPLGMRYSTFRQPLPKALAPYMATGYPRASEPAKPFEIVGPAPAGALSSSGVDMARFMLAHLQNGRGILRPETARTMHDSPLDHVDPMSLIPPLNRMELGFFETNVNGREVIAHLGDLENFHTSLHLFLADNVGLYVSFNSAGKEGAAGKLRGALFQDFADRYFPSTVRDRQVDPKTAAKHVRMMVGQWENSRHSESNFLGITRLLGQTSVSVGPKGELVVTALTGLGGAPRRWVEIAPFVWRDRDSEDRLAAKLVDGKVVRWSFDGISPFMVFDRAPAGLSMSWIKPAFIAAVVILLLTFLYWPVGWYVRRRYKAAPSIGGTALRAYRATRIMAGLDLLLLVGWGVLMSVILGDTTKLGDPTDPWLRLLQIAGAVILVGAVGIAGWNAWLSWRDGRRWTRRIWNTLVLLATLVLLYVMHAAGLLAQTVNY